MFLPIISRWHCLFHLIVITIAQLKQQTCVSDFLCGTIMAYRMEGMRLNQTHISTITIYFATKNKPGVYIILLGQAIKSRVQT